MAGLGQLKQAMGFTVFLVLAALAFLITVVGVALSLSPTWSLILGLFIAFLFMLLQFAIGPSIVAASNRLRYLSRGENPWLEQTVQELSQKSGIPPPRLAVVSDPTPNAFVFGHTSSNATLALHTGLLNDLTEDEVKGVIGHELGHIRHRDFIVVTMLSAVPLIAYIVARSIFWSTAGSRGKKEKAGAIVAIALVAYLVYILTTVFVLYLSRLREHYADAYSAYVTGSPHSLQSALTKIAYGLSLTRSEPHGARAFFIEDQVQAKRECAEIISKKSQYDLDRDGVLDERELMLAMEQEAKSRWASVNSAFATHPPVFRRILLLRQIEQEMQTGKFASGDLYRFV